MPSTPATPEMLAEMRACAYRLGLAFGREAEGAGDLGRRLEMFQLFDRCFFAVRVSIALELRLRREAGWAVSHGAGGEAERETEALETERAESDRPERERLDADREREPATFPVLLNTLQGVAAEAAALPGAKPGVLPTLQDILARAKAAPPAGPIAPSRAGTAPLRDRLAGSAAVTVATLPPRAPPGPPAHRPTGPPRR